jgi:hypothetical protein
VGWLADLFAGARPLTLDQDLELLVARWTNPSRDGAFSQLELAGRLEEKADEIRHAWNRPQPKIKPSQGA